MSGDAPAISVVVPTRNRAQRLRALLASLAEQQAPPFEVVVVDNASDDDTLAAIAEADAAADVRVHAIHLPQPMGPAVARNRGWRAARGELIVFTDDDVVARPGWLAGLYAGHEREPRAVIQGQTVPDPREADRLSAFARSQSASGPGPWFQTCNIAYPRALLDELGGFDESFWEAAGEDTDLGWRAVESGARVVYEPDAVNWHAVHDVGPLGLIRSSQKWRLGVRNVARHPDLRAALPARFFWKRSHAFLLLALVVRRPVAFLPYVVEQRGQHGSYAGTLAALPAHLALDAAEMVAMLRGSFANRTLLL